MSDGSQSAMTRTRAEAITAEIAAWAHIPTERPVAIT
jgi:hypothetical protein